MVKNFKERLIDAVKKGPVLIFVIPDGTDSNGKQRIETDYDQLIESTVHSIDKDITVKFLNDDGNEAMQLREEM